MSFPRFGLSLAHFFCIATFIVIATTRHAVAGFDPIVSSSGMFASENVQSVVSTISGITTAGGNIQSNASKFKGLFAIGDISIRSTNVYGQVSVGGSFMQSASRFGETHQINPADFDFQQITESLIATSRNISTNLTNETAIVFSGGTWNLFGSDPLFNYFEIDIPAINPTFSIHVPEGATTILNFGASHYDFFQTTIQVAQPTGFGVDSSQLLINFPAARSLNFQFSQIQGTILAPIAQANIFGSNLGGQIIASNISIFGSNMKGQSFQGYFEKPADLPNQPTIVVLIEGLVCLRAFRWIQSRRKVRSVKTRPFDDHDGLLSSTTEDRSTFMSLKTQTR